MDRPLTRRALLATTISTSAGLAGCIGTQSTGSDSPDETATASSTQSTTATDTRTVTRTATSDAESNTLFLENHDGTARTVSVVACPDEATEAALDGTFELPANQGVALEGLGEAGATYSLAARLDGGELRTDSFSNERCADEEYTPDGDRNAAVRVREGQLMVVSTACDSRLFHSGVEDWADRDSARTGQSGIPCGGTSA
ncbi:hypothetical protein [Haloarchaeobius sp. TZWWS8]|uniref:hypothetical protein n=1 Tax=Haloarchaeobius sp. TZWWS8 TaxID=3446121 RepID=UPI003EC12841